MSIVGRGIGQPATGVISAWGYGRGIFVQLPGLLCPSEFEFTEMEITEEELVLLTASEYAPVFTVSEDEATEFEPTHTAPSFAATDALVADMEASHAEHADMQATHRALEAFEITEEAPSLVPIEEERTAFDTLTELASLLTPDQEPGEC